MPNYETMMTSSMTSGKSEFGNFSSVNMMLKGFMDLQKEQLENWIQKWQFLEALKWGAMQGDQIDKFYQIAAWLWDSLIKIASRLWNCFRLFESCNRNRNKADPKPLNSFLFVIFFFIKCKTLLHIVILLYKIYMSTFTAVFNLP